MPLKVNIGFSRKVGERNYSSRGASTNLELELDSGLVEAPDRLRERIRQLIALARQSVADELQGQNGQTNGRVHGLNHAGGESGNGHGGNSIGVNGQSNGNGHSRPATNSDVDRRPTDRRATQSQVRAIYAITHRQKLDMTRLLRDRFQLERPADLSLRDASLLIDELNSASRPEESRR